LPKRLGKATAASAGVLMDKHANPMKSENTPLQVFASQPSSIILRTLMELPPL
jgi:hypothetical protein